MPNPPPQPSPEMVKIAEELVRMHGECVTMSVWRVNKPALVAAIAHSLHSSTRVQPGHDDLVKAADEFLYAIHQWRSGGMLVQGVQVAEEAFRAALAAAQGQ